MGWPGSCILRAAATTSSPPSAVSLLTSLRLFSPSARRGRAPPPPVQPAHHFMVDYLISSCGLSGAEALRASKTLAHLKSPEKPDAVLRLLRQEGLGGAHIRRAVVRTPRVLFADAKKTLEPKIRVLKGAGFSRPEIAQLVSLNPYVMYLRDLLHRVEFWRELIGTNQDLLKVMKRDSSLLAHSLKNKILPNLSFLRSLGFTDSKMRRLVLTRSWLVSASPSRLQALFEQAKSLGFSPGSPMFVVAISSLCNISTSNLDAKSKFLRSFGWTEAELTSAIRRFPAILSYSEKKIQTMMDFLLNETGFEPSEIARRPILVGFSMEKRLMPRLYVLQCLKTKGLPLRSKGFRAMLDITERTFIRRYIIPYSDQLPELLKTYNALRAKPAKS